MVGYRANNQLGYISFSGSNSRGPAKITQLIFQA